MVLGKIISHIVSFFTGEKPQKRRRKSTPRAKVRKNVRPVKKQVKKTAAKKRAKKTVKKTTAKKTVKKTVKKKARPKVKARAKTKSKAKPKSKATPLATVTHYFDRIQVAVLKLNAPLSVGDRITMTGPQGEFVQLVLSMQIDRKDIIKAAKGKEVGIRVGAKVSVNTPVYLAAKG